MEENNFIEHCRQWVSGDESNLTDEFWQAVEEMHPEDIRSMLSGQKKCRCGKQINNGILCEYCEASELVKRRLVHVSEESQDMFAGDYDG